MKKLKIEMSSLKGELLSREQLKMLMGGDKLSGDDCQESGESCNTQEALNCCNGFHCANFKCFPKGE